MLIWLLTQEIELKKIFWIVVGFTGIIWALWFIPDQYKLWEENPAIITKQGAKLSDIEYPAITFVPPGTTKYGIAERLGNYINPEEMPHAIYEIRNIFLKCLAMKSTDTGLHGDIKDYKERDLYDEYMMKCVFPYGYQSPGKIQACQESRN